MKYADLYPGPGYILESVCGRLFRAVEPRPCVLCKDTCGFISYHFPRPAVPVCGPTCFVWLETLQRNNAKKED
jgi:hypothetical protein